MQNVIIMRHGLAENDHVDGDFFRCLTTSGKIGVKKIAKQINQYCIDNNLSLSRITHSPFERTTKTASIVYDCFVKSDNVNNFKHAEISVEKEEKLVPSANISSLIKSWRETSASEASVLVTHQPFVSQLISELVNGDVSHAGQYPMHPSDAVFLSGDFFSSGLMSLQAKFSVLPQ